MKIVSKILIPFLLIIAVVGTGYSQKHHQNKKPIKKKEKNVKAHKHQPHHHKHYAHLPKKGFVSAKPKGAMLVVHSGHNYHFHQGVWYKPHQDKFIVFRPHAGLRVKLLPPKHHICIVRKRTYYYYYGTYYSKVEGTDEYEVIDVPIGAQVSEIPSDYQLKDVDGIEHYIVDDVHYIYHVDTEMYEVVSVE